MQDILTIPAVVPYYEAGQQNFYQRTARWLSEHKKILRRSKMFDDMLKGMNCDCNCGCQETPKPKKCSTSCDVLWIIILVMVVLKGGFFGLDLCTLVILFIVFGKDIMCKLRSTSCCGK